MLSIQICRFEECGLCSSLISAGSSSKCTNTECNTFYHELCMKDFIKTTAKLDCPKCNTLITNE